MENTEKVEDMTEKTDGQNKTENDNKEKDPFSYHTFVFPFYFVGNDPEKKIRNFRKNVLKGSHWKKQTCDVTSLDYYSQYRYFNPAARNVIFGIEDTSKFKELRHTVHNYVFDKESLMSGDEKDKRLKYVIRKGDKVYSLEINNIRLRLYNTGIGMLVYELENYLYSGIDDINSINDWGRRLYMPYTFVYKNEKDANDAKNGKYCTGGMCADSISIAYGDVDKIKSQISILDSVSLKVTLPEIITYFLKKGKSGVTTEKPKNNEFKIEPVIGDRMYVACIYRNEQLVSAISKWDEENLRYKYLTHALEKGTLEKDNLAKQLYELFFVDGDGSSCHDRQMLHDMLRDHGYSRWIEFKYNGACSGTIMGVTEYSMISLTTVFGESPVHTSFLLDYVEMAELVLAQRTSLLVFERLISDCAMKKNDVQRVQERYILFQSQFMLREITPEQQGIEIYEELLESSYVERLNSEIERQLNSLFELKNYKNDKIESAILFIIAVLGISEFADFLVENFRPMCLVSGYKSVVEWLDKIVGLPVSGIDSKIPVFIVLAIAAIVLYGAYKRKK